MSPSCSRNALRTSCDDLQFQMDFGAPRNIMGRDVEAAALRRQRSGRLPAGVAMGCKSSVADITSSRRSSRRFRWLSMHSASPRSAFRLRSWNSSKMTQPMPVRRRIVLQHAGENAFRDHFDARLAADPGFESRTKSDRAADRLAEQCRHAAGDGARGDAPRLQHQDLLTRRARGVRAAKSGTRVLLPAPGGASSSTLRCSAKAWPGPAAPH